MNSCFARKMLLFCSSVNVGSPYSSTLRLRLQMTVTELKLYITFDLTFIAPTTGSEGLDSS